MTLKKVEKALSGLLQEAGMVGGSSTKAVEKEIEYIIDGLKDLQDMKHDERKREEEMKPTMPPIPAPSGGSSASASAPAPPSGGS